MQYEFINNMKNILWKSHTEYSVQVIVNDRRGIDEASWILPRTTKKSHYDHFQVEKKIIHVKF